MNALICSHMNRRKVFKSLAALAVAPAAAPLAQVPDDTAFVQWMIDNSLRIPPGTWHITKTLVLKSGTHIHGSHFTGSFDGTFLEAGHGAENIRVTNCVFRFRK